MYKNIFKDSIFIKKGKLRGGVLNLLEKPFTATELSKKLGKHRSSISRILIDFEKVGLVRCINKEDDRFRHYVLTKRGREVKRSYNLTNSSLLNI